MTFSQDGNKNCAPNFSGRNELVPRYHLNSRRAGHSKLCNGSEPSGLTASAWLVITKVEYPEELDTRFSQFTEAGDEELFSNMGAVGNVERKGKRNNNQEKTQRKDISQLLSHGELNTNLLFFTVIILSLIHI